MMGRKNHSSERPQKRPESAREKNNPRMLKIFRMTDPEDSASLRGVMLDLAREEEFPQMAKIHAQHPVFVLDPRIVSREFKSGFEAGFNFGAARKNVEDGLAEDQDIISARLTSIRFIGHNSRIIGTYLQSTGLRDERIAAYRCLADSGLSGFRKKEHRTPSAPVLILGQTAYPISDAGQKKDVLDVVETALIVHHAMDIVLGKPVITEIAA